MNLKSRIDYLCKINRISIDNLGVLNEEMDMLEKGLIRLPRSTTRRLSEVFERPVSYFEDYDRTDHTLHQLLQEFQYKLMTPEEHLEPIIKQIETYHPIPSMRQELVYHLLLAVYHYKKQQLDHANWLETNYLGFFLNKGDQLNHNIILDKALFHYLGMKYFFEQKCEESKRYFEELVELTKYHYEIKLTFTKPIYFNEDKKLSFA